MEGLKHEARRFLAWQSVVRDQAALKLDEYQRREGAEGVARTQLDTARQEPGAPGRESGAGLAIPPAQGGPRPGGEPQRPPLPRRFFAAVEINPDRAGRDMGQITEEVLQHLTVLPGCKVTVKVDIDAAVPHGIADDVQRVINENCQTLRFRSHGFEQS